MELIATLLLNLKEFSAARKALEIAGEISKAHILLDQAGNLLKEGPYSDNKGAVDYLVDRAKVSLLCQP